MTVIGNQEYPDFINELLVALTRHRVPVTVERLSYGVPINSRGKDGAVGICIGDFGKSGHVCLRALEGEIYACARYDYEIASGTRVTGLPDLVELAIKWGRITAEKMGRVPDDSAIQEWLPQSWIDVALHETRQIAGDEQVTEEYVLA